MLHPLHGYNRTYVDLIADATKQIGIYRPRAILFNEDEAANAERALLDKFEEQRSKKQFKSNKRNILPALSYVPPSPRKRPAVFGYTRVSGFESFESGQSNERQADNIKRYFDYKMADTCDFMGVVDDDSNISAKAVPFHERPGGKKILSQIHQGDHIVIERIDRLSRNLIDFACFAEWCRIYNVYLHILQLGDVNTQTPAGRLFLNIIAVCAQMEADNASERMRIHHATRRRKNKSHIDHGAPLFIVSRKKTFGIKRVNGNYLWDQRERHNMALAVVLIEYMGLTQFQASYCLKMHLMDQGMPGCNENLFALMYAQELTILHNAIVDPMKMLSPEACLAGAADHMKMNKVHYHSKKRTPKIKSGCTE